MPRHPATIHLLTLAIELATQNDFHAEAPLSLAVDEIMAEADRLDDWLTDTQSPEPTEH